MLRLRRPKKLESLDEEVSVWFVEVDAVLEWAASLAGVDLPSNAPRRLPREEGLALGRVGDEFSARLVGGGGEEAGPRELLGREPEPGELSEAEARMDDDGYVDTSCELA